MSRGNPNGLDIEYRKTLRPREDWKGRVDDLAPWVPPMSHEILRDLGMSDDAIAQYFCRFRHGRSEQFVEMVLHKRGWMCRSGRGHMSNEGVVSWPKRNTTPS